MATCAINGHLWGPLGKCVMCGHPAPTPSDMLAALRSLGAASHPMAPVCQQAADEIERLRAERQWQPIETAPRDGTIILAANCGGVWMAKYMPIYQSGYRPPNSWFSLMLNCAHMGRHPSLVPTHWMPLPAAPGDAP